MSYSLFTFGRTAILICKPGAEGLGPVVAEIMDCLYRSRHLGASLFLIKPKRPLNHEVFEITCAEVPIIRPNGAWPVLLRTAWFTSHAWPDMRTRFRNWFLNRSKQWMAQPGLSGLRRNRIRSVRNRVAGWREEPATHPRLAEAVRAVDLRREYAERPLAASLRPEKAREGERQAAAAGLDSTRPIVTLHVRESTYKRALGLPERAKDEIRNATVANYRPAVRELVARGYQVVRIGDASASPLECPGALDLAVSPLRTDLLEMWCLTQSRFLIACDSGPYTFAVLLGVPTLTVNVTAVAATSPVRTGDLYMLKHVVEADTGRELPLQEMLTADYLLNYRTGRYAFLENSDAELREAVVEMEESLRASRPATPAQEEFHTRLRDALQSDMFRGWLASKGRPTDFYVGRGRVVHSFADQSFGTARQSSVAKHL